MKEEVEAVLRPGRWSRRREERPCPPAAAAVGDGCGASVGGAGSVAVGVARPGSSGTAPAGSDPIVVATVSSGAATLDGGGERATTAVDVGAAVVAVVLDAASDVVLGPTATVGDGASIATVATCSEPPSLRATTMPPITAAAMSAVASSATSAVRRYAPRTEVGKPSGRQALVACVVTVEPVSPSRARLVTVAFAEHGGSRERHGERTSRQVHGGDQGSPPVRAGGAALDVAGDLGTDLEVEPSVPAPQQCGEVGAVLGAAPSDQHRADRLAQAGLQTVHRDVGLRAGHADDIGQVAALQPVAEVQVEQFLVAVVEPERRIAHERGRLCGGDRICGVPLVGGHVGELRRVGQQRWLPNRVDHLVARDRVQPGPQSGGITELADPRCRPQERVLHGVARRRPVAQARERRRTGRSRSGRRPRRTPIGRPPPTPSPALRRTSSRWPRADPRFGCR